MVKMNYVLILAVILTAAVLFCGCATTPPPVTPTPTATTPVVTTPAPALQYSQGEFDLKNNMRKLWTDHTVWTRVYIIRSLADAPDASAAANRLLKNQEDIGDAIKPVYGDAAGTNLTAKLKDHILIAVDIINDVKAKNATKQAADEARWTANADDIAVFLAGANPNWPEATLKDLLHMHLATTKDELVARYSGNYTADIIAYDRVYDHILVMSDALSDGIIKQNPNKFPGAKKYTQAEVNLYSGMRKLWTDHTVWTRMYIIASLDNAPDANNAAARLLKNQEDIGNAIKPVYGDAAGNALTAKLKDHILIAVDIIDDVKAKNATKQAADEARWTANADDIAVFLAGANPNWPEATLKDLMHTHLATTKDELVARVSMNWTADVTAYDRVYDHILTMSDALSGGIVQQFPAMFGK